MTKYRHRGTRIRTFSVIAMTFFRHRVRGWCLLGEGQLVDAFGHDGDEHDVSHHARAALHVSEYASDRPQFLEPYHGVLGLPLADAEMLGELLVAALQVVGGEALLVGDNVARVLVANLSGTVPVEDVREYVYRYEVGLARRRRYGLVPGRGYDVARDGHGCHGVHGFVSGQLSWNHALLSS